MITASILRNQRSLARTINVSLHLGDPKDNGWCIQVTAETLDTIHKAGFTALRLGVQWAAHCQKGGPYTIDPGVFEKVDAVIACAQRYELAVVLNNCLDPELMENPAEHKARFLAITRQVAAHFWEAPESVMFELLAEPRGKLDRVWNDYLTAALAVAREQNPARAIIIGPAAYNNARKLPDLRLPDNDRNLIVTIHHYWPLNFTMQGEEWFQLPWIMKIFLGNPKSWPGTTWEGTPRQQAVLKQMFDRAANWSKTHDRPLFVGEFGSSNTADMPSRVRWACFIRKLCEERGFSWGYWSYGPGFALRDVKNNCWHENLLEALVTN